MKEKETADRYQRDTRGEEMGEAEIRTSWHDGESVPDVVLLFLLFFLFFPSPLSPRYPGFLSQCLSLAYLLALAQVVFPVTYAASSTGNGASLLSNFEPLVFLEQYVLFPVCSCLARPLLWLGSLVFVPLVPLASLVSLTSISFIAPLTFSLSLNATDRAYLPPLISCSHYSSRSFSGSHLFVLFFVSFALPLCLFLLLSKNTSITLFLALP